MLVDGVLEPRRERLYISYPERVTRMAAPREVKTNTVKSSRLVSQLKKSGILIQNVMAHAMHQLQLNPTMTSYASCSLRTVPKPLRNIRSISVLRLLTPSSVSLRSSPGLA